MILYIYKHRPVKANSDRTEAPTPAVYRGHLPHVEGQTGEGTCELDHGTCTLFRVDAHSSPSACREDPTPETRLFSRNSYHICDERTEMRYHRPRRNRLRVIANYGSRLAAEQFHAPARTTHPQQATHRCTRRSTYCIRSAGSRGFMATTEGTLTCCPTTATGTTDIAVGESPRTGVVRTRLAEYVVQDRRVRNG